VSALHAKEKNYYMSRSCKFGLQRPWCIYKQRLILIIFYIAVVQ